MLTRIDHASVWTAGQLSLLSILIHDQTIEALLPPENADWVQVDQVIDAGNCWVLPGGVDYHVHISDGTETIQNGTCCAAVGGITTVLDMAPFHGCISLEQFQQKIIGIEESGIIDIGIIAGIVIDQTDLNNLQELADIGAAYFKVFQPSEPALSKETLWTAVQAAARTGLRLSLHAEDPLLFKPYNSSDSVLAFANSRPAAAETASVALFLEMAHAVGAPVHVCHVSSGRSADLIDWGKNHGIDVTCEVPPHYLLLDENAYWQYGARAKTTPPIRTEVDKANLWNALSSGVIDVLACDHYFEGNSGIPGDAASIKDAPAGIAGLEVSLPLLFDSVIQKKLEIKRFVEITSVIPARLAGLSNRKGKILPGMDADLTIWDPKDNWIVSSTGPFSRIEKTPFQGWNLQGRVRKTIVRGKVVWDGKNISAPAGYGKWIPSRE